MYIYLCKPIDRLPVNYTTYKINIMPISYSHIGIVIS